MARRRRRARRPCSPQASAAWWWARSIRIRGIDGVVSAESVTGPFDIIVRSEASDMDDLGRMVVSRIQAVAGITRTQTCPVVNL